MIKYLFIHGLGTLALFTVWVNNLGLSGEEIGMAPIGFAIILIIPLSVGVIISFLLRSQLTHRKSLLIAFGVYLIFYQLLPVFAGDEPWLEGITDSGSNGMINRAFVFAPLITGILVSVVIILREPRAKKNG